MKIYFVLNAHQQSQLAEKVNHTKKYVNCPRDHWTRSIQCSIMKHAQQQRTETVNSNSETPLSNSHFH